MAKPSRNTKQIYYDIACVVREHAPVSRAEIACRLHRSPTTVGRAVDQLIAESIVCELGQEKRDGVGRPSRLLVFNSEIFSVMTVDISSLEVFAAITDLSGKVFLRAKHSLPLRDTEHSLPVLIEFIHEMFYRGAHLPPIEALVIGAPSIVNADEGVIEWAPSLNWRNIPLKEILEREFNVAVLVENDVNLAALGEFWKGAGHTTKENMIFVSVGEGVGSGIIINGELYLGATHAAGEVAYFITDVNVLRENAGEFGNIESQIGRDGLVRMAHLVAYRYPASRLAQKLSQEGQSVRTRDIMALAEAGDVAAMVVYNYVVDILTIVICNTAVLLDPEIVILGGPCDWNWSHLIESIKDRLGTSLLRPVNIKPSKLGREALIMGGSYSALKLRSIFAKSG
jgi:glucokinase